MVKIKQLFIDRRCETDHLSKRLQSFTEGAVTYIDDPDTIIQDPEYDRSDMVLLTPLKGPLLKKCPGTSKYLCCNYHILNTQIQCPYQCGYCILQTYFPSRLQIVHAGIEQHLSQVAEILSSHPERKYRIGTGEFTDSLAMDPVTKMSLRLIDFFKDYPQVIFELKTKSVNIDHLLTRKSPGNVVIAWSINTPRIIHDLEPGTPTIEERMVAAQRVIAQGYDVAFHFDPIVLYEGCEKDYISVVDRIYDNIPGKSIRWISLGMLRFTKQLKPIFFDKSPLFINEFILADDQKYRYLRFERTKMFHTIYQAIKKHHSDQFVYLCMESEAVWRKVFGFSLENNESFETWFNRNVF